MTTSEFDSMWKMLSENSFEIESNSKNEDLLCMICKDIMIDACQSVCGCRYCHKCISDYLGNVDKYCPGKTAECKEEELILDRDVLQNVTLNRRISTQIVKCHTCQFKLELSQMNEHLGSCVKVQERCLFQKIGCGSMGTVRSDLRRHFGTETINHSELMIDWMADMKNDVNRLTEQVKGYQMEILTMKAETKENEIEIFMLKNELGSMASELRLKKSKIESLEQQLEENNKSKVNKIEDSSDVKPKKGDKSEDNCGNEGSKMKVEIENRIEKINEGLERNSIEMNELEILYNDLKKTIIDSRTFEFVWKVDNFSRVIHKRFGSRKDVYSDSFYTDTNGYRMRLSMYPNKFECEKHLVIYLSLVPGMFDAILKWPFKGTVTLGVVDQNIGTLCFEFVANYKTATEQYNYVFQRPSNNANEGYGYDIKLQDLLRSPSLVVNDTVFVKCSVVSHRSDHF